MLFHKLFYLIGDNLIKLVFDFLSQVPLRLVPMMIIIIASMNFIFLLPVFLLRQQFFAFFLFIRIRFKPIIILVIVVLRCQFWIRFYRFHFAYLQFIIWLNRSWFLFYLATLTFFILDYRYSLWLFSVCLKVFVCLINIFYWCNTTNF
jgi:hypothetical protein